MLLSADMIWKIIGRFESPCDATNMERIIDIHLNKSCFFLSECTEDFTDNANYRSFAKKLTSKICDFVFSFACFS